MQCVPMRKIITTNVTYNHFTSRLLTPTIILVYLAKMAMCKKMKTVLLFHH